MPRPSYDQPGRRPSLLIRGNIQQEGSVAGITFLGGIALFNEARNNLTDLQTKITASACLGVPTRSIARALDISTKQFDAALADAYTDLEVPHRRRPALFKAGLRQGTLDIVQSAPVDLFPVEGWQLGLIALLSEGLSLPEIETNNLLPTPLDIDIRNALQGTSAKVGFGGQELLVAGALMTGQLVA